MYKEVRYSYNVKVSLLKINIIYTVSLLHELCTNCNTYSYVCQHLVLCLPFSSICYLQLHLPASVLMMSPKWAKHNKIVNALGDNLFNLYTLTWLSHKHSEHSY